VRSLYLVVRLFARIIESNLGCLGREVVGEPEPFSGEFLSIHLNLNFLLHVL